jgi:hypothetical protein
MTRIHDLLGLPETGRKGDFVQSLTGGTGTPEKTVRDYAFTPAIVAAYRQALSIVDSALVTGRAGLQELVPWLLQWHDEPRPAYNGQRLGSRVRVR